MNDEALEELNDILSSLTAETGQMNPREKSFVEDQIKRLEQYGANIRMSEKQWEWLRQIHKKYV